MPDKSSPFLASLTSAANLELQHFPETQYVLKGILPVGLSLLVAKPKIGKSWFVLDLARTQAQGGVFLGETLAEGNVLYLALEDQGPRIKNRLKMIQPSGSWSNRLELAFRSPMIGSGLEDGIREWADDREKPRLIVIDTFGRVMTQTPRGQNDFLHTNQTLGVLQEIAHDYNMGILFVHHTTKGTFNIDDPNFDPFDLVHGTTALHGVMDATLVLDRRRYNTNAVLMTTGRDFEETKIALEFDQKTGIWNRGALDPRDVLDVTPERLAVLKTMAQGVTKTGEIALSLDKTKSSISNFLSELAEQGLIENVAHGKYRLTDHVKEILGNKPELSETHEPEHVKAAPGEVGQHLAQAEYQVVRPELQF